ncbi:MAG: deoxyribose-phosphate aldolase [Saprospiraceae bacterium]|nr:deoxyribose-phosphate aldolase [Saprospiraceae bacterium]
MKKSDINQRIDHTLLRANATNTEIQQLCEEAVKFGFATVCIPPYYIGKAKKWLQKSKVGICTVIGFPLGYQHIAVKVEECKKAIEEGADELDVVVNIAAVKNGDWDTISSEVDHLATMTRMRDKVIKLIFETAYLNEDEIRQLCELCIRNEVDYAKTSTGFANEGAKVETIRFMSEILGDKVKIKASGGIKTKEHAEQMIEAGADRIGTSSGVSIVEG